MTKRKKKKTKFRRRLLFLIFIVVFLFFIKYNEEENIINIDFNNTKSYLNNTSGISINDEYKKIIIKYLDLYTDSLVNLKSRDVTYLFTDKEGAELYLTQTTIDTQVYHHSLQINDMKLKNAYYDINITNVIEKDNKVTIEFIENDYYNFNYLDNITSSIYGIENTIVLNNNNGKYSIDSLRVVRDNYVIFTNVLETSFTKNDIDKLKNKYERLFREELIKNKRLLEYANNNEFIQTNKCDHTYNREKALEYSYKYITNRNENYFDYSTLGGNCANFASQSIHEGGIPMDYEGNNRWKYYSDYLNEKNTKSGRSGSWTSTYYFYEYAKYNTGYGLCAQVDVNIYYAEIGDIIHVGYKDDIKYSHTTLVSKIIKKDDKIIDILVNSNTTNLKDYPIMGYIYQNKRLIKILGYND